MRYDQQNRLQLLKRLLTNTEVGSQEDLKRSLNKMGHNVTQATLSRDLKKLKATKVRKGEYFVYVLPEHPLYERIESSKKKLSNLQHNGVLNLEFSGNIAVIHTRPSYAGMIASTIDSSRLPSVCGTVAGDDTIMVIVREGYDRERVSAELASCLPNID